MSKKKPKYTCEICTDYIDPTKKDEILQRCAKIIRESLIRQAAEKTTKEDEEKI